MTSFCRHRRLEATCPICSRKRRQEELAATKPARPPRASKPEGARRASSGGGGRGGRRGPAGDVRVRRLARAADDGYEHELVPGLRASADARSLALELAFSAARLGELSGPSPPGLYGEAAASGRSGGVEEGLWLAFLIAVLGPLAGEEDAFAAIEAARVPWSAAASLSLPGDVRLGPRGVADVAAAASALDAYRAWAERGGGQAAALAGESPWSPERRFDRAFERLALPGLGRAERYDFLLTAGALGLADVRPAGLQLLADPRDATVLAAKRVFGIGDLLLVGRRANALAAACALPLCALDLALVNWGRLTDDPDAGRITCGCYAEPDRDALALALEALGVSGEPDAAGEDGATV